MMAETISALRLVTLCALLTLAHAAPASVGSAAAAAAPQSKRARRSQKRPPARPPDVLYYATPEETVTAMLDLANIRPGDVLYDLGSGDGRIPIEAARRYGIRAVGVEIDSKLVAEAGERARRAGVAHLVSFRQENLFRTDFSEASVVTLYLSNTINLRLRPRLLRELRPGARILSHDFHMGDWKPEQTVRVPWGRLYRTVYLWTVPERGGVRKRVGRGVASARPPGRARGRKPPVNLNTDGDVNAETHSNHLPPSPLPRRDLRAD